MEKPNGYISLKDYIREVGTLPEKQAKKVYIDVSLLFMMCKNIQPSLLQCCFVKQVYMLTY